MRRSLAVFVAYLLLLLHALPVYGQGIGGGIFGGLLRKSGGTLTGALGAGRIVSAPFTPTASVTGFGATPTVTVATGSSDLAGTIQVTAGGAGPLAAGTIVVTFSAASAYGTNASSCVGMLANGTGAWNARATVIGTVSGGLNTSHSFTWDNNAVATVAASVYNFQYVCLGR